jgi:hypothetical protein
MKVKTDEESSRLQGVAELIRIFFCPETNVV